MGAAADFDLEIYVDGLKIDDVGDVSITREYSGLGTSGLSTSQLTFSCPTLPYDVNRAGVVKIKCSGVNLPLFYINSRSQSEGKTTFNCLDRMAYTDEPIRGISVKDGKVQTSAVFEYMAIVCGFEGDRISIPEWLTYLPQEKIEGVSFDQFLEEISTIMCGVFYVNQNNELAFLHFGDYHDLIYITKHTALDYGTKYSPSGVLIVNGDTEYARGNTEYTYDTIQINSDLGCDEAAAELWERIKDVSCDAVNCSKAVIDTIPNIGASAEFAQGGTFRIGSIRASITCGGIVASLAAAAPGGSEIGQRTKLRRALDNKPDFNKQYGAMLHTAYQGIILVDGEETVNSG